MNMNQFTQKSIEALRDMQSIALENGNQQIEQIHLLDALASKEDGLIPNLVKQSGASIEKIKTLTDQAISFLPKVSGVQADKLYLSRELDAAFTEAEAQAKKMKEEIACSVCCFIFSMEAPDFFTRLGISPSSLDTRASSRWICSIC